MKQARQMGRPQRCRFIEKPPEHTAFKPLGKERNKLQEVTLSIDEYEALRLCDYLGNTHEEGATAMKISRPVFTRLVDSAHKKVADAIINGKLLLIEGGNVHYKQVPAT